MDSAQFVEAIKRHVRNVAVEATLDNLKSPPGRRVPPDERARSEWYNGLSDLEANHVKSVVANAVDETIFGLFAVLDGSRVIEDGRFELVHVDKTPVLLNDPNKIGLNELFNAVD